MYYFRNICKENQVVVFTWWFFWIRLHCIEWRPAASIYLSIFTATFFTWCVGVFWGKISTAWKEWPVTNCLSRCRRSFAISFLSLATTALYSDRPRLWHISLHAKGKLTMERQRVNGGFESYWKWKKEKIISLDKFTNWRLLRFGFKC